MKFINRSRALFFIALLLIGGIGGWGYFSAKRHVRWNRYFERTLYREPSSIVVQAAKLFPEKGNAIDLGCGVGNETAFLLRDGWKVWAVDGDPSAIKWIDSREDLPEDTHLVFANSPFEEVDWSLFPESQLIIAVNSLPFCNPTSFPGVWRQIEQKLASGGRFAGHFFCERYAGFSENEKGAMTFLTKEKVLSLLENFDIEYFEELEEDGNSATGKNIHSHRFEVIARKR